MKLDDGDDETVVSAVICSKLTYSSPGVGKLRPARSFHVAFGHLQRDEPCTLLILCGIQGICEHDDLFLLFT